MKKTICLLVMLACLAGTVLPAFAETGFEALYGLFCAEEAFGQPVSEYDYDSQESDTGEDEDVSVCFVFFMFDTEYDTTGVILIGANAQAEEKYVQWITDNNMGATVMTFLISRFQEIKDMCAEGVDFCIAFSFNGGETMTEIATAEDAEAFTAALQQSAGE